MKLTVNLFVLFAFVVVINFGKTKNLNQELEHILNAPSYLALSEDQQLLILKTLCNIFDTKLKKQKMLSTKESVTKLSKTKFIG